MMLLLILLLSVPAYVQAIYGTSTPPYYPPTTTLRYIPPTTTPQYIPPTTTPRYIPPTTTPEYYPPTTTPRYIPPTTTPRYIPPTTTPEYYPPTTTPRYIPPTTTPVYYPPTTTPRYIPPTTTPVYYPPTTTPRYNPPTTTTTRYPVYTSSSPYVTTTNSYTATNADMQASIKACSSTLSDLVSKGSDYATNDLMKKISSALTSCQDLSYDQTTLQQLSPYISRMKKATTMANNCRQSALLPRNLGNLNGNMVWWMNRGTNPTPHRVQNLFNTASLCIERYC